MAKTNDGDEVPPEWMSEEATRAARQTAAGKLVNERAVVKKRPVKPPKAQRPTRVLRGWRPSRTRAAAFDALVAEQKNTSGKNGPKLIDEALDLLLKRYGKH